MIGRRTILSAFAGAALLALAPAAQAGPGLALSDSVKSHLLAANPVEKRGVTRESFNGKPLLVIFFASW